MQGALVSPASCSRKFGVATNMQAANRKEAGAHVIGRLDLHSGHWHRMETIM